MTKFDPHLLFNPVSKKNFRPPHLVSQPPHLKKNFAPPTSFWTIRTLPFLHDKNLFQNKKFLDDSFFTQFLLSHASDNTRAYFSKYWGTDAWAVPPPHILEGTIPQSPLSLRP